MNIKIKAFESHCVPEKIEKGDWIDLYTRNDEELIPEVSKGISLGVAMQLPPNHEAHLLARSSSFSKYGFILTNGMGVIDESYCGDNDEWILRVYPTRHVTIPKGTRIAQFRIVEKMPEITFEVVDALNNEDRGGHGSTGN